MPIELFDARMLGPLLGFLQANGIQHEPLLDRTRISAQLIRSGGWISKKQAYDFTFEVVRRSGCQESVYSAYTAFGLEQLGPVAVAMRSCKTVKDSLEVGLQLGSIAYEGNEYFLRIEEDTTWICYREPRVISIGQPYINDMTLAVYAQLVRTLVNAEWRPERVLLRGELDDRHRCSDQFSQCQIARHAGITALAIPTEFLARRLPPEIQATEDSVDDPWRFGPEDDGPCAEKLYRLLAANFTCRKLPTLEQIAMIVDTSEATLKRMLSASGTSYRRVLDRLRFDEATRMLEIPELTIREAASELGFSDASNFARSFYRMTGMTPTQYRRDQLGVEPNVR